MEKVLGHTKSPTSRSGSKAASARSRGSSWRLKDWTGTEPGGTKTRLSFELWESEQDGESRLDWREPLESGWRVCHYAVFVRG